MFIKNNLFTKPEIIDEGFSVNKSNKPWLSYHKGNNYDYGSSQIFPSNVKKVKEMNQHLFSLK